MRSVIGMGYYDCVTPPVILRNVMENPGWYTAYTPYQPEISQGRLEALLNFQTMVTDLTGMEIANASLLDEATAAAEAMAMCHRVSKSDSNVFFVSERCHPQTIDVVRTRAEPVGIRSHRRRRPRGLAEGRVFGCCCNIRRSTGRSTTTRRMVESAHQRGALVCVAADLLALLLLTPPGEWGADIVIGSAQRFGVPLGFGGPHAAYIATRDAHKRSLPGRLVGVSVDARGRPAMRLALQTREQHIRREKATSNICTAQVLLAVMAGFYAVYHGPNRLRTIAERVHRLTAILADGLKRLGTLADRSAFFRYAGHSGGRRGGGTSAGRCGRLQPAAYRRPACRHLARRDDDARRCRSLVARRFRARRSGLYGRCAGQDAAGCDSGGAAAKVAPA